MTAPKMTAAGLALFLTLGASAEGCDDQQRRESTRNERIHPGEVDPGPPEESCDKVRWASGGTRGWVVGSEWTSPDYEYTCLEITRKRKAKAGRLYRVSRKVFDRCIEGDRYEAGRCTEPPGE